MSQAVFLSYASQDAGAAGRLCDSLRAAGIEVWFDQSELRGGDAWDATIRQQIKACTLFVPVISSSTQARGEGYFRLEWKLAVDRSHLMAADQAFLLPVVIDDTSDTGARVPDRFREVQWMRCPDGQVPAAFLARVKALLGPGPDASAQAATQGSATTAALLRPATPRRRTRAWLALLGAAGIAAACLAVSRWVLPSRGPASTAERAVATAAPDAAFIPPPHSIAVLPFTNMGGDKEQEYFSDGLTEELLNSLAGIDGLQVAARTSAFSFKGKDSDIGTIARKLNVGAVLEGSVRRSARTVRISAQLIDAVTGFHLWSKTYDRDSGDVLKLQTEIATAVAGALKVALQVDPAAKIELGGTRHPAAFDAYLHGLKLARVAAASRPMQCQAPIDAFDQAIALDDRFALAYANRAFLAIECADNSNGWLAHSGDAHIRADAQRSIALAPGLPQGYLALSRLEQGSLRLAQADEACAQARSLAPGDTQVLYECGSLAAFLGHADAAIADVRRAVALDPLNPGTHRALGEAFRFARRYREAVAAYQAAVEADPEHSAEAYGLRGLAYYLAGDLPAARASCEAKRGDFRSELCLAIVYDRIGRHADARAVLAGIMRGGGDAAAFQYAEIYAQWGERNHALDWLEKALRLRDPGLVYTKLDPLLDPLRGEPRYQAVLSELKFPS